MSGRDAERSRAALRPERLLLVSCVASRGRPSIMLPSKRRISSVVGSVWGKMNPVAMPFLSSDVVYPADFVRAFSVSQFLQHSVVSVSYTHLTLPTTPYV